MPAYGRLTGRGNMSKKRLDVLLFEKGLCPSRERAKIAIMEDYRKLPKSTAKQRKYYRQAEGKFKRLERKQSQIRLENLFKSIEAQDPSICKLALG